jgi:hypothetical protein
MQSNESESCTARHSRSYGNESHRAMKFAENASWSAYCQTIWCGFG